MANPFDIFQTDAIRIISKDKSNISRTLKAHVTTGKINLYELDVVILDGDFVERDLPNNRTELYLIFEANYHNGLMPIPAHYILKVRKTTAVTSNAPVKNVYNLNGHNTRVYNNSNDHSINHFNNSNKDVFNLLKEVINDKITDNQKLLALLEEMHQSKGSNNYLEKYTAFITNSANHMTLISPFIPALTALIPGH